MSAGLDRRSFLGGAAAAGAIAAAVPLTARAFAFADDHTVRSSSGEPLVPRGSPQEAADADWHIDDMWGHTPRYAHPIPYSPMRTSPIAWEHVDPIDRFLVI